MTGLPRRLWLRLALVPLLVLSAAGAAFSQEEEEISIPEELDPVLVRALELLPESLLVELFATIDEDGRATCAKGKGGRYDRWGLIMRSRADRMFMIMDCGKGRPTQAYIRRRPPLYTSFIGVDEALKTLKDAGIRRRRGQKVKARLSLMPKFDERGSPVWAFEFGRRTHLVDARTGKLLSRAPSSAAPEDPLDRNAAPARKKRRKKGGGPKNTALRNFSRVERYAKKKFKGGWLVGIEALTDGRGKTQLCVPGQDGWFFYYVTKQQRVRAVYDCEGKVGEARPSRPPFSPLKHRRLEGKFINSSEAMTTLKRKLGRRPKRATMKLAHPKRSPFKEGKVYWIIKLGRTKHYIDAIGGWYIGKKR